MEKEYFQDADPHWCSGVVRPRPWISSNQKGNYCDRILILKTFHAGKQCGRQRGGTHFEWQITKQGDPTILDKLKNDFLFDRLDGTFELQLDGQRPDGFYQIDVKMRVESSMVPFPSSPFLLRCFSSLEHYFLTRLSLYTRGLSLDLCRIIFNMLQVNLAREIYDRQTWEWKTI